jgi:hypothetical protein
MTKIKTAVSLLFVGVMALGASESSKAALIDRGSGLIYDNVLDVTWAQDTALSQTLGGAGIFNWGGAKAWADQLVFGGYDDWRLPTLSPVNGVRFNTVFHCDGSADYGYGVAAPGGASSGFTGNELAYMYHVNLGNKSRCTGEGPYLDGKTWGPDVGVQNASFVDALTGGTVSFLNLQDLKTNFWTDYVPFIDSGGASYSWMFKYSGFNDWANTIQRGRAWAVRDGDVLVATVPEPSTLLLLFGLLPAFLFTKKRKRSRQHFA